MKKFIFALLLACLAVAHKVWAIEYSQIVTEKSTLTFTYTMMGAPVEGRFGKFAARIDFDPTRLAAARASLDLDLASIDAGSGEANEEVSGKAWFDSRNFPQARFVSTGIKALGGNRYEITGRMTIKGRTRDIVAPFTLVPQNNAAVLLEGTFVLRRADFAIGEGIWSDTGTIANEIRIRFRFLASLASKK